MCCAMENNTYTSHYKEVVLRICQTNSKTPDSQIIIIIFDSYQIRFQSVCVGNTTVMTQPAVQIGMNAFSF